MSRCIYHAVPRCGVVGEYLVPLNALKNVAFDIYEDAQGKYVDRTELQNLYIDTLECFWGDVIFMTSIHPQILVDTFAHYGFTIGGQYYQIPISMLDQSRLCLLHPKMKLPLREDFAQFHKDLLESDISDRMRQYLEEKKGEQENPFLFAYSQHVLYRGMIKLSSVRVVSTD